MSHEMKTSKTEQNIQGVGILVILTLLLSALDISKAHAQQRPDHTVYTMDYMVDLPNGYGNHKDRKWPLVVFLHDRKSTPVNRAGPKTANTVDGDGPAPPFVVVSPSRGGRPWNMGTLNLLLDKVMGEHSIDADRVHLVGHGVWDWAFTDPERFASLTVLSECPKKRHWGDAWRLRNMPILMVKGNGPEDSCQGKMARCLSGHNGKVDFLPSGDELDMQGLYGWLKGKDRKANAPKLVLPREGLLREYEGRYAFDGDTFTIAMDKGRLMIGRGNGGSRELVAESDTTFLFANNPFAGLTFTRGADGRVDGFEILPSSDKKGVKVD